MTMIPQRKLDKFRLIFVIKKNVKNFAHLSLKTSTPCRRQLDSGCSHHMIGNTRALTKHQSCNGGTITFGDYVKKSTFGISDVNSSFKLNMVKSTRNLTIEYAKEAHVNAVLTETNNAPKAVELKEITQTQEVASPKST
ncbi:hypothetical protein M9H77_22174 [Catharanthus roseus]|uniref:Uncharacterized protein n=1 Tax=Catharanthus roseus TaxID=4058 RepID=A0ACC0ATR6_CATRO|nr:hypothetical protein M9H77_22174 [Catharanthus roseus]